MARPWVSLLTSALLALNALPAPVNAQQGVPEQADPSQTPDQESTTDPQAPEPAEPKAIDPSEIAPRAEEAAGRLREIREMLAPVPAIAEIEEAIPALEQDIQGLQSESDALIEDPSSRALTSLRGRWASLAGMLGEWQPILQQRCDALHEARKEMEALLSLWENTSDGEAPDALRERIRSTLSEIRTVGRDLTETLDGALTLQNRIC